MRKDKIGNLLLKISRKQKIPQSEYALVGETPIIDQSSGTLIVGYTDNQDARHEAPLPITVFETILVKSNMSIFLLQVAQMVLSYYIQIVMI